MTKRYREALDSVRCEGGAPIAFRWRGRTYEVRHVLGHWREDPGWWRRSDGRAIRIEQADLWRVEAGTGRAGGRPGGVYEVVRRGEHWHLDRVWD